MENNEEKTSKKKFIQSTLEFSILPIKYPNPNYINHNEITSNTINQLQQTTLNFSSITYKKH
ncbi:2137_t:CDS:1, partial [Cetraspora pellucida]